MASSTPCDATAPLSHVLVAVETFSGYQRRIVQGVIAYAGRHRPTWDFLFDPRPAVNRAEKLGRFPDAEGVIAHLDPREPAVGLAMRRFRERGVPVVVVEQLPAEGVPAVLIDNGAIGRMAFDHLRGKGFTRFAFLGGPGPWVFAERRAAFAAAVEGAGMGGVLEPPPGSEDWGMSAGSRDAMRAWVAGLPKPVGLLAANVDLARRAASACREVGAAVPESVAVLGVDHDELVSQLTVPPLSVIDHGMERAGFEAAALLDRLMRGEPPPADPVVLPPAGVIERQSTDTLAVEDEDVREAVRLIREGAADGLGVPGVLRAIPVSRRKLELGFRRHLGRTMHGEVVRVRVERAKRLLAETEMPLPEVAERCAFRHASRLSEAFARHVGRTPSAYRRASRGG